MDQPNSGATAKAAPQEKILLNVLPVIENYLGEGLLAKENANMSHLSPAGLLLVLGEEALKLHYLHSIRKAGFTDLAKWHEEGFVHIHDLGLGVKTPYCSGHSLENLLHDGISAGNIISGPAKRLRSAVNHIINHIGACSNEFAGAQAFNDVDLFLGPYALDFYISRINRFKMDPAMAMKMTLEEVDQSMQEMIFHLNYNTRYGGQCVDAATECLTHKGWKRYDELSVGDSIYVVDLETGMVKSDKLTHVNVYDHDGDLLHFSGEGYESVVTEKHRVVYTDYGRGKLCVREAAELEKAEGKYYIPKIERLDTRYTPSITGEFAVTKVKRERYKGKVWCPTTSTGTFIARRNVLGHKRNMFVTGNSPFSNISLALSVPKDMEDRRPLVGGKHLEDRWGKDIFECSCFGDHITYRDLEMWQNIVAEAILNNFLRGDSRGTGFTFPVLTVSVTPEFFDHPLKNKVFELSAKFGNPYFQNYINGHSAGKKIEPADVRSMCPLHGDTLVPVRAGRGVFIRKIKDVFDTQETKGVVYDVLHNGAWEQAKAVSVESTTEVHIETRNGAQVIMDPRHEQPVKRRPGAALEVLTASAIDDTMYLPFASESIAAEQNNYAAGFAVGAFVGDGTLTLNGVNKDVAMLTFSLSKTAKKRDALRMLQEFFEGQGYVSSTAEKDDVALITLRIGGSGPALESWIRQYVAGDDAQSKSFLTRAFQLGERFLRGVLDGWHATDGGNRGRIYTSSQQLATQFCHICGMLGVHYNMCFDKPDTRDGRLGENPVYICKEHTQKSYAGAFFYEDGYYWFPIERVHTRNNSKATKMYCFAVDSDEHLFQLANGLVTHNCRLQLDNTVLRKHVGGLFGNADQTGSLQVVTLNLPMIALGAVSGDAKMPREVKLREFLLAVQTIMEEVKAEQLWKREIVEKSFDEGFFAMAKANFKRGFKTFFTTVGFVGLWEAVEFISGSEDSFLEEKNLQMAEDILTFMRELTEQWTEETGKLFNLEATPAESAAHKLAIKMLKKFPNAPHRGTPEAPYLTNSCHIPVELQGQVDLLVNTQAVLQTIPSGGTVVHLHTGEQLDAAGVEAMVRAMCSTPIPYFSVSPVYSRCECCGKLIPGTHEFCPYEHTEEQVAAFRARYPEYVED